MDAQKQGKIIGNVGILDLRSATEEAVAEIQMIGNVGTVLYTAETAHLVSRLKVGNLGTSLETADEVALRTGQEILSRDSFKNKGSALHLVVAGQLIIKPDVPEDDVEQGLSSLVVLGQMLYPQHLAGVLQPKIRHIAGQAQAYRYGKLVVGTLRLDQTYLQALEDNAEMSITDKLIAVQILPNDLLAQKIGKIEVFRELICREENAPALLARLDNSGGKTKVTIIPAGFEVVEKDLLLDAVLLEVLPGRKLYCRRVRIDAGVEAEALTNALDELIVTEMLICPAGLKGAIARKCNLLETDAIFYQGELWLIEDDFTLAAARFDYLADKATLINRGDLTIEASVEPKLLADRLDKVHNFGDIFCTSGQMAALQARLGINHGDLISSDQPDSGEENTNRIGNVGHLKL